MWTASPLPYAKSATKPAFSLKSARIRFKSKKTKTGKRGTVKTVTKVFAIELEMKLDEQKREDIALAFQAEPLKTSGKQVTASAPPTMTDGQEVKLDGFNLSALTAKDSTMACL